MGRPLTNRDNYWSEDHERILWYLARKVYRQTGFDEPAELVNAAWLHLARRYPEGKSCIYWLQKYMWRYVLQGRRFEFDENVDKVSWDQQDLDDRDLVEFILGKLSEKDRRIIEMRYLEGRVMKVIAKEFGLSRQCISAHLKRIMERLRYEYRYEAFYSARSAGGSGSDAAASSDPRLHQAEC